MVESMYSQYAWLIPLFPLIAFLLLTVLGKRLQTFGTITSILAVLVSFVLSLLVLIERIGGNVENYTWDEFEWLRIGDAVLTIGYEITNLNALMLVIVTFVSLLVNVYSAGYMKHDPRITVYYSYVSLFTFAMLALVIAENLVEFYIFWELVGLCSFLLIGFWFEKPEAKKAAKKAFIVTRIGDVGLFVAILLLYWNMPGNALDFSSIHNAFQSGEISGGLATAMALLIFAGAVGKSGQFPLHVWLPDAMEGPTPISALIHAATMVAAGVFLVARTFDIFLASPAALAAVAYVGAFTALFAATIAVAQNDIKRILAYSTVSQLGYMMMAMGIGTLVSYAAGLFHLYTHAFFKALLFLAAGSVIHALNRQDIREMGGVGKQMKITMWTFAIGTLALSGIFPFSGFWSKDAILSAVYEEHRALFWIGWIAAFFTAFYMARLFFLVFAGEKRYDGEAHESPPVMTVPLVILAVLAVAAGFIYPPASGGFAAWLTGAELGGHANWTVMILSNLAGIAGLALGWLIYARGTIPRDLVSARAPGVVRMLAKKYYIDEFYEGVIVRGLRGLGCLLLAIDRYIVDGAVMLSAAIVRGVGNAGTRLQNGQLQTYGLITLLGFVIIFIALVGRRYFHVG